jgi:hypothetical protein
LHYLKGYRRAISIDSPKEQRPRKLSGKRTVTVLNNLERNGASHIIHRRKKIAATDGLADVIEDLRYHRQMGHNDSLNIRS